jgi:ribose/xylose/arabinose/galactoside ABC-type transport system permease subunit
VRHRAGGDDAGGLADGGIPLTLLLGLLCGLVNAALIHYTGISPLVITLGTLYLYGGGALLLSGMAGRRVMKALAVSRTALPPSPT